MYYLLYGFFYLISLLPFPILYLLSDGIYFFVYRWVGYRREIVMNNLKTAFPEKTTAEHKAIAKKFYHNFCDTFLEAAKLLTISKKQLNKRFIGDYSLLNQLYSEGKSCQIHLGHNFNWEWGNAHISLHTKFNFLGVYMPIDNKAVNKFFINLRSKFGTILLPANNMQKAMLPYRKQQYILALVADQNPGNVNKACWIDFFGKSIPFVMGPERAARANNMPVLFANIEKQKRGYYKCSFEMLAENAATKTDMEITTAFVKKLEHNIRQQPENWLWSHRRWKWIQ